MDRLAADQAEVDRGEADLAEGTAEAMATETVEAMATAGAMEEVTATAEAMATAIEPAFSYWPDVTNGPIIGRPIAVWTSIFLGSMPPWKEA